jgi:hypothetical protein
MPPLEAAAGGSLAAAGSARVAGSAARSGRASGRSATSGAGDAAVARSGAVSCVSAAGWLGLRLGRVAGAAGGVGAVCCVSLAGWLGLRLGRVAGAAGVRGGGGVGKGGAVCCVSPAGWLGLRLGRVSGWAGAAARDPYAGTVRVGASPGARSDRLPAADGGCTAPLTGVALRRERRMNEEIAAWLGLALPSAAAPGSVPAETRRPVVALGAPAGAVPLPRGSAPVESLSGETASALAASTAACMRRSCACDRTGRLDAAGADLASPGTRRLSGRLSSSIRSNPPGESTPQVKGTTRSITSQVQKPLVVIVELARIATEHAKLGGCRYSSWASGQEFAENRTSLCAGQYVLVGGVRFYRP